MEPDFETDSGLSTRSRPVSLHNFTDGLQRSVKQFVGKRFPGGRTMVRNWRYERANTDAIWRRKANDTLRIAADMERRAYPETRPQSYDEIAYDAFSNHAIVEINTTCNIDCLMCKTSLSTRRKGRITKDNLQFILDQLAGIGVDTVSLHTIGDPLANPRLAEVFSELRKRRMFTGISTNGLMLSRHIKTFQEYTDVCSFLRFSADGATKETYERIRKGGNWEQFLENVELAHRTLKPYGFSFEFVMTISDDNRHEVGLFIERFRPYAQHPSRDITFGFVGSLSPDNSYFDQVNPFPAYTYSHRMCGFPKGLTFFTHMDGDVSVCCRDYDGSLEIGNLKNQSPEEIIRGPAIRKLQRAHETGDLSAYPLCAKCYLTDPRIAAIFKTYIGSLMYWKPDAGADFYQRKVDEFMELFKERRNTLAESVKALWAGDLPQAL